VLLVIELLVIGAVLGTAAWPATSHGAAAVAVAAAVCLVASAILFAVASAVVPDDAPPAPSWFAARRASRRLRAGRVAQS
jgi:hypothetical protein